VASFQPDVSSIRFLTATFLMEVGSKIARSDHMVELDDDVLHFDALTSFFTEKDKAFHAEWTAIQQDRADNEALDDSDPSIQPDKAFRYRELRAMVRSAVRQGILYKVEPPKTTWDAEAKL